MQSFNCHLLSRGQDIEKMALENASFKYFAISIDLFLDSDSFYNCIPHFSSERSD